MKLAYIWIEKYRNIKEEGFNFSLEYEFNFTKKDGLSLKERKNINIFPENTNFTTIVGKNGSGKSSLIENILLSNFGSIDISETIKMFAIYYDDLEKRFYCFAQNNDLLKKIHCTHINNIQVVFNDNLSNKIFNLYINYGLDVPSSQFSKLLFIKDHLGFIYDFEETPNTNNILAIPNKTGHKIDIQQTFKEFIKFYLNVKKEYSFNDETLKEFILNSFEHDKNLIFSPKKFKLLFDRQIYFSFFSNSKHSAILNNFITKYPPNNIKNLLKLSILYILLGIDSKAWSSEELFYKINNKYIRCKILIGHLNKLKEELEKYEKKIRGMDKSDKLMVEGDKHIQELVQELDYIIEEFINDFSDTSLEKCFGNSMKSLFPSIHATSWYIDYINGTNSIRKSNMNLFDEQWNMIDDHIMNNLLINLPPFILVDLEDTRGRNFLDLSFGEKLLNFLLYELLYFTKFFHKYRDYHTINIVYDEFDIGMHPDMQRRFINFLVSLINLINKEHSNIKINVFLATHSPMILSDIPMQNVILLDKGKNISIAKKETFGANLYDILDKNFILDNSIGLYSESIIKTISLVLSYFIALKRSEDNIYILRKLLNRWYISDKEELDNEEIKKQDIKLLNEVHDDMEQTLLKLLKKENSDDSFLYKIVDFEKKLINPKIEQYINIIGDEVINTHLLNLYSQVKGL